MVPLQRFWLLLTPFMLTVIGCSNVEPPPSQNRDLGDERTILLPTASVWCNPAIAKGQAEWQPFREPALEERSAEAPAVDEADSDGDAEIEAEIRALVEEYNGFVADGTIDDLLGFYVEEQQDALRPLLEAGMRLSEKLGELRDELDAELPEAGERIGEAFEALAGDMDLRIRLESVTVLSDSEVVGKLSSGSEPPTLLFKVMDEDWYIEFPDIEKILSIPESVVDLALSTYDGWLQGLGSGQASAETVLQQVEAAAQAAEAARRATEGGAAGTAAIPEADDGNATAETSDDSGGNTEGG